MAEKIELDQIEGIGTLANLTTTNKNSLVDAVNEVNGKSFSISVGAAMGEINQTNGNAIYVNSIAISNKQDANSHPKNSGGLQAFSYNAPSAVNYPVVAGAGGGGGISFYRNNSAGGLLSSFDIVKAEHSEEKLRFRVGISTTAKGGWKTFASEEYVNDTIAGLGLDAIGTTNLLASTKEMKGQAYKTSTVFRGFNVLTVDNIVTYKDAYRGFTIDIPDETEYVVSFYAKASTNLTIGCFFHAPNTTTYSESSTGHTGTAIDGTSYVNITTTWKKYWVKWKQTVPTSVKSVSIGRLQTAGATLDVAGIKLERGSVPTDWSPHPNDVVTDWNETDSNALSFMKNKPTLVNNYLDTILTTNGTTAGTVYTFKRVGLSDLTLTLTAASASFSGVVTTGPQMFEGQKTFLKSPKVPVAVNNDEAVNKGQLDAVQGNYLPKSYGNTAAIAVSYRSVNASFPANSKIKIKLPYTTTNSTMISFTIRVYGSYRHYDIACNGYLYNTIGNWYLSSAKFIVSQGNAGHTPITVIFGIDTDGKAYVSIPRLQYMGIAVLDVVYGFSLATPDNTGGSGWTITEDDTTPNIGNTVILEPLNRLGQLTNDVGYVLASQVYTQAQALGLFVGKTGVETIQDTKTFTHSPVVPNATLSGHTVNLGQLNTLLSGYALSSAIPTNNNQLANGAGYITATALGGYVLQTSLTTQLANYVTANGVQNITATKTFTVSPVVPNGTLAGHTVNLGQMQTYVAGLGYQTAAQVTTIVNNAISAIPAPGNGSVILQGIGSLTGTATFSMNQANNTVGSFDLTPITKNEIAAGATAGVQIVGLFGDCQNYFDHVDVSAGGTIDVNETFYNLLDPHGAQPTVNVTNHHVHGARLILHSYNGVGSVKYIGEFVIEDSHYSEVNPENGQKMEFTWNEESQVWIYVLPN